MACYAVVDMAFIYAYSDFLIKTTKDSNSSQGVSNSSVMVNDSFNIDITSYAKLFIAYLLVNAV